MNKYIVMGVIMVILILMSWPASIVSASTEPASEIDITISPEEYLFDITNMKPGDWAPRTIHIKNNGTGEFKYTTMLEKESGSDKLFHELLLEVRDANEELYNGKLADFGKLSPRSLSPSSGDELTFTVAFPEHSGNEFQGLSTNFTLIFQAVGDQNTDQAISTGTVGGGGGSQLPDTATDMFTYLLIGFALVALGGIIYFFNRIRQRNRRNLADLDM